MVLAVESARSIWPARMRLMFSTAPPVTSALYVRVESANDKRLAMAPPSG